MPLAREERDQKWEKSFMELVDYKAKFGDCHVPAIKNKGDANANPYKVLYNWCCAQRSFRRRGKLLEERIQRLTALGFSWKGVAIEGFEQKVQELQEFKTLHGHCNVPQTHVKLGCWVQHVRVAYDKKTLPQWKIDQLNAIGFIWRIRPPSIRRKDHPNHNSYISQQSAYTDTTRTATDHGNDTSDDTVAAAQAPPDTTTTDNNPILSSSPPRKKPRVTRKRPPISTSTRTQLHQVFSDVSGTGDFGDWVSDQIDFLKQMSSTRLSDQKSCLEIVCRMQQRVQQWNDSLANCKQELLDLTNPIRNLNDNAPGSIIEKDGEEGNISESHSWSL